MGSNQQWKQKDGWPNRQTPAQPNNEHWYGWRSPRNVRWQQQPTEYKQQQVREPSPRILCQPCSTEQTCLRAIRLELKQGHRAGKPGTILRWQRPSTAKTPNSSNIQLQSPTENRWRNLKQLLQTKDSRFRQQGCQRSRDNTFSCPDNDASRTTGCRSCKQQRPTKEIG